MSAVPRHRRPSRDSRGAVGPPTDALLLRSMLGLFAISGVARALDVGLPTVSAVLIGTLTAVGGGVLVSILQGQIPEILLAGAPNALLAVWGSITYAAVEPSSTVAASFVGIASVIVAQYLAKHLGVTTRPAGRGGGTTTEAS